MEIILNKCDNGGESVIFQINATNLVEIELNSYSNAITLQLPKISSSKLRLVANILNEKIECLRKKYSNGEEDGKLIGQHKAILARNCTLETRIFTNGDGGKDHIWLNSILKMSHCRMILTSAIITPEILIEIANMIDTNESENFSNHIKGT